MTSIVDYGMGNLASVSWALERLNIPHRITGNSTDLEEDEIIILPGVGSFSKAMKNLRERNLDQAIIKQVRENKKTLLGICLGMQLLAEKGEEEELTEGLGLIPGTVKGIPETGLRIPHIGWNDIESKPGEWLENFNGKDFYFIHSFYFDVTNSEDSSATVEYGKNLTAAVHKENIFGTQFHPEKSQENGLNLIKHFYSLHA